jgi:crossover junction endodeoxyribonuclease RusA
MGELKPRTLHLTLPWPPSVNHYWRHVGHKILISKIGREYRAGVVAALFGHGVQPIDGRLAVVVEAYPPDNRRRDLDNIQKALLDSMQHGGAYADDSQIDRIEVIRCEVVSGGKVDVRISQIGGEQ